MRSTFLSGLSLAAVLLAQAHPAPASPLDTDPPADTAHPASFAEVAVPSHGVQLLGTLYIAAGAGAHPTAILFHGFPGFELNGDLAQVLRRAGYNVLIAHYRGSWGVSGTFSFQHAIEDADAEVVWVRSAAVAAQYHIDPARIVVLGHSLGGFIALSAAAHEPAVVAAVAISAASLGSRFANVRPADRDKAVRQYVVRANPVEFLALAGTSPQALGREVFDHRAEWSFQHLAPELGKRPVLLVTAHDGSGPASEALLQALRSAGNTRSQHLEFPTDHPYSDHRIALERAILDWLAHL